MKNLVFSLFLIMFVQKANSALIFVDADSFADGTDISNAFTGVTLSTVFGNTIGTPTSIGGVFAEDDAHATTGANVFAHSGSSIGWGNGSFEYMLVEFGQLVSFVSLDFFTNDSSDSNPELVAFDSLGNEILRTSFLSSVTNFVNLSVTSSTPSIASVRAYWDEVSRVENGGIDNLSYRVESVPVPATLSIFVLALIGLMLRTKNKKHSL
jgi:hypothetical protein